MGGLDDVMDRIDDVTMSCKRRLWAVWLKSNSQQMASQQQNRNITTSLHKAEGGGRQSDVTITACDGSTA